ncbi:hypothetical protein HFX_6118 (plasmid) [Haloferax mediterranei ATCC 33500]|uniref:Uncharacterized protein n=1 Tax=Haloferax mediterranei (strain ATCC 33500 / DSM 1411 / JCM 8866 / NBRC 14739 / NCIMB 2177 / R-4) TaxID=523841 RepID=I3RAI2_HALMT|nr:hypothetical protein HFX_6118 [Haloferax mediterranei ATCC 33500]
MCGIMTEWAQHYDEIPKALSNNGEIRLHALELIADEPIIGKCLEGGTRKEDFRTILSELVKGEIDHATAEQRVSSELPPSNSLHMGNNHVFNSQWKERLIRSQLSRFYNQSVMEILEERGDSECFVPRSPREDTTSDCTQQLAGGKHATSELLRALYSQQRQGNWNDGVTVPGHANCTHTVVPTELAQNN